MPVSVIVGGQYGSEGKGKVAHFFAKEQKATAAIRVGGPNSGHTVISENGQPIIFKHLPTAAIIKGVKCVLTAGNYLNIDVLEHEISISNINPSDLLIDPFAVIITDEDVQKESSGELINRIGSTGCGLGSAVTNRISRNNSVLFAKDVESLRKYIGNTNEYLRCILDENKRVILEGTQGFGLSLLHSNVHPYCTSRDTTAASFLSEAGLSPFDVDDIILVIRAFPIRVAGNSGPLNDEISWNQLSSLAGSENLIQEYTSVTKKLRRVAEFHEEVVKRSISYNNPTKIVLNHLDYVDSNDCLSSAKVKNFIAQIETKINRKLSFIGIDRRSLVSLNHNMLVF